MAQVYRGQTTDNRYPGAQKNNAACVDASKVQRKESKPMHQSVGKLSPKQLGSTKKRS